MNQKSILVVDDDRDFLLLITRCLKDSGYKVQCAQDPLQAAVIAQHETPDLVLLDIKMPAGGGLAVLQRFKMSAKTSGVPIVVVTAYRDSRIEERALAAGVRRILYKPCDETALLECIEDILYDAG